MPLRTAILLLSFGTMELLLIPASSQTPPAAVAPGKQPDANLTAKRLQAEQLAKDGKAKEGEAAFRQVVDEAQKTLGAEHAFTLHTRMLLFRLIGDAGRFQESVEGLREVLAAQKRALPPESEDTLKTLDSLSIILRLSGRAKEAEATATEVELGWRMRVKALTQREGPEHSYTLMSRSSLAIALHDQGKYAEAAAELRAVLEVRKRVLGPEHPDTLASQNNLTIALMGQGRFAEAETEIRALVKINERVLGPEHPATLMSRSNLAEALRSQGQPAEAETENRAVLKLRERVLGPEHPDTLMSRNNLATALLGQGKHAEAEPELRAVLKLREQVLGPEHSDTLKNRNNLAIALIGQDRYAEAETEIRALVKINEQVLGPEHPDTLISRNNLAEALRSQGKNAEAETENRAVMKLRERVLGPEHPATLVSRNNLAATLIGQSKYVEAETECRALIKIQQRVLGATPPDKQLTILNLAMSLAGQQKHAAAVAALQPVAQFGSADSQYQLAVMMAQGQANFKPDSVEAYKWAALAAAQGHEQAKQSLETLKSALTPEERAQLMHAEAEAEHREVLKTQERLLGPEHPDTLMSRMNLAIALGGQGKHAEAEAECRAVLKIQERLSGREHPDTLQGRNNLAAALAGQGKYAEAEAECRSLIKTQEHVLGAKHPENHLTFMNLAFALAGQQKHQEALEALQPLAKFGSAEVQFQQAVKFAQGQTFKQDPVEAYKWAFLAAAKGHEQAKQSMHSLEGVLTSAQLAEAKKRLQTALETVAPTVHVPKLSMPAPNAILSNGTFDRKSHADWHFHWQPVASATAYQLWVQLKGASQPAVSQRTTITSYHHTGFVVYNSHLQDWTWKVRAEVQGQWQPWSEERPFSVAPMKPGAAVPNTADSDGTKLPYNNLVAMFQQVLQLEREGRPQEASVLCQKVVTGAQKALGDDHAFTMNSRKYYSRMLMTEGRHAAAEAELRLLVNVMEQMRGPEHTESLATRNSLATALYRQNKHAEAEAEYRAVLRVQERVLGPEHADTLYTRGQLAFELGLQGKHAEAEAENRALLKIHERQMGPAHPGSQGARIALAIALAGQQKHAEVGAILQPLAKIGSALNQYNLAVMMTQGTRLKKDPVEAYKWAVLAAAQGHAQVKNHIKILEGILKPEQLAEGKRRAAEFIKTTNSK